MFNFFSSGWDDMFKFNYEFNSSGDSHNWEELKKKGVVEETVEEKNGFKTVTRKFTSFDGAQTITSSSTSLIVDETKQKLIEIDKQIAAAVKNEDYEKAATLKKEKEQLTKKPKK